MIKLLNFKGKEIVYTLTKFPDQTSQVWQIEETPAIILWQFENESELMHLCQLAQLCVKHFKVRPRLICPFLPYGRQDKEIQNDTTFAKNTLLTVLKSVGFTSLETFDAHSLESMIIPVLSLKATKFLASVSDKHDFICFPDKGAYERYNHLFNKPCVILEKKRDPKTGIITGMEVLGSNPKEIKDKKVLIVDDIADGGATFIGASKCLQTFGPKQIDLAVSHGIFSKGKRILHNAGIKKIYTTNTLKQRSKCYDAIKQLLET